MLNTPFLYNILYIFSLNSFSFLISNIKIAKSIIYFFIYSNFYIFILLYLIGNNILLLLPPGITFNGFIILFISFTKLSILNNICKKEFKKQVLPLFLNPNGSGISLILFDLFFFAKTSK